MAESTSSDGADLTCRQRPAALLFVRPLIGKCQLPRADDPGQETTYAALFKLIN
jgi:hypothetical protein